MPKAAASPLVPADLEVSEKEAHSSWIARKLAGTTTARLAMSSFETLRSASTTIICLSPWGDSSPLILPCFRLRDLVAHTVIVATGGSAALLEPVMGHMSDLVVNSVVDAHATITEMLLVEFALHEGIQAASDAVDGFFTDEFVKMILHFRSPSLEGQTVKVVEITIKLQHIQEDAALGFFRGSLHRDSSLFSSVKDYLSVEKGWMSPYLYASGRRPVIPRTMTPDFVFCHGPFLNGDYQVGKSLLSHSKSSMHFCAAPRSTRPTQNRRLVLFVLGIKPHRLHLWTTSKRPGESVLQYILLSGVPAIVLPAAHGAPLIAWHTKTLQQLWKLSLPADAAAAVAHGQQLAIKGSQNEESANTFEGVLAALAEYVGMCVDWSRVDLPGASAVDEEGQRVEVNRALAFLLAAAVRSGESKKVKNKVDPERAGIAFWRIV